MTKERIVIVGGLSAGPSAAAKARRENEQCEIILFEKTSNISYATCGIPYALSGKVNSRDKLMVVNAQLLRDRFNIDVRLNEPVIDIDTEARKVITPQGTYTYSKLIFATGATAFTPPVKGLEAITAWSHCKTIENFDKMLADRVLQDKHSVTVMGAGLIGIEVAENLIDAGKEVNLVEMADTVLPLWDAKFGTMAGKVLRQQGVNVFAGSYLQEIIPVDQNSFEIVLNTGHRFVTSYLVVGVGVRPNTQLLLAEGAEHLKNGAIVVDEHMQTSLPDIYAAGDCASIKNLVTGKPDYFPMGTHSNKGGRAAGANAAGSEQVLKGAYGTAIVKVFDHTLARTGMNAESLKKHHIPFKSTFFVAPATPGFYPDAKDLFVELYYHPDTRVLLGAEIFGEHGVDKRIDVLSTCIYARLALDDLPQLDLAYAPPFSPAKDAVISAGYIADNSRKGKFKEVAPDVLDRQPGGNGQHPVNILDVRSPAEVKAMGKIPGAVNVPLESLRKSLTRFNTSHETIVYCQRGLRGYVAALVLAHNGFKNIINLAGGFVAWERVVGRVQQTSNGQNGKQPLKEVVKY